MLLSDLINYNKINVETHYLCILLWGIIKSFEDFRNGSTYCVAR
jgi:hypothetical protein